MHQLVSQGYTGFTVRWCGLGAGGRKTQASMRGGVPTAFCSIAISIVVCAAADHPQILDLDTEALKQQVSVFVVTGDRPCTPSAVAWSPCSNHAMHLIRLLLHAHPLLLPAPHPSASGCSSRRARWTSWWWRQTCATRQQWSVQSRSTSAGACAHSSVHQPPQSRCHQQPVGLVQCTLFRRSRQAGTQEHTAPVAQQRIPVLSFLSCRFGGLDVALLCAGIGERGDFLDAGRTTEQLEKTVDIDLTAVIAGTRVVAQAMVDGRRGGRIVSIASAAGGRSTRG